MKNVVTIGGGNGHSQVLKALKHIDGIKITGICPSTDSGGSTGVLLKEYDGSGYTGDLTRCIVALCHNEVLAKALNFRYENGPLDSHSVKNLLFHALEKVEGPAEAFEALWEVCGLAGNRVLPVTNEKTELCATLSIGETITGEANIDTIAKNPLWNPDIHSISDIFLRPPVSASSVVIESLAEADFIVICPGDLYSSVIPVLLPQGVKEAIGRSRAKIILILNLMTKKGETDNYTAIDFVDKIEKRLGRKADYVVYNTADIPDEILLRYALEQKVELGNFTDEHDARLIAAPLAKVSDFKQVYSDPIAIRDAVMHILNAA